MCICVFIRYNLSLIKLRDRLFCFQPFPLLLIQSSGPKTTAFLKKMLRFAIFGCLHNFQTQFLCKKTEPDGFPAAPGSAVLTRYSINIVRNLKHLRFRQNGIDIKLMFHAVCKPIHHIAVSIVKSTKIGVCLSEINGFISNVLTVCYNNRTVFRNSNGNLNEITCFIFVIKRIWFCSVKEISSLYTNPPGYNEAAYPSGRAD